MKYNIGASAAKRAAEVPNISTSISDTTHCQLFQGTSCAKGSKISYKGKVTSPEALEKKVLVYKIPRLERLLFQNLFFSGQSNYMYNIF